jgi:hypothetical protein
VGWILFTRDFNKLRLVLSAAGSIVLLFFVVNTGLLRLADWAEAKYGYYPLRNEDYLRCLLPSMYENRGRNRILLAGPSEVREGFLGDQFENELPGMSVFNGGLSQGTFDDLLISLDYIKKVYGPSAMPEVMVLGITPRYVANILSENGQSPLVASINRYSPYYRVEQTPEGSKLVPKSAWDGFVSWLRFLPKNQSRYRPALSAASYEIYRRLLETNAIAGRTGIGKMLERRVRDNRLPYKYHNNRHPWKDEALKAWLNEPESFWFKSKLWDPEKDKARVQEQFAKLKQIARDWNIRLYVVNTPEHPLVRNSYPPGRYEQYLQLVTETLQDTPLLNLRDLLAPNEFFDLAHPTYAGAQRETAQVVRFLKERSEPTAQRAANR